MPFEITMPQQSDTMTEGKVVKWLKKEGDKIKSGETVVEIETDKAVMEAESFEAGTIALILTKEGDKANVGAPIAIVAVGSEKVEDVKKKYASGNGAAPKPPAAAAPTAPPVAPLSRPHDIEEGAPEVEAQNRATAKQLATAPRSTAAPQHAVAATIAAPSNDGGRVIVSPLARRIATDKGIDLHSLRGSGPRGRIVQADVLAASPGTQAPGKPLVSIELPARVETGQKQVVPLTKIRSVIAQRLQQSKQTVPHFYETIDVDVEDLSKTRERINKQLEKSGVRLSLADFLVKSLSRALTDHPALNAHFMGSEIVMYGDVHLGIAVALPTGLIVPVLRNVNQMGLTEIRTRSADLIERARAQKLKQSELSGATFTISNLGTYGIREFSAIINPPEVAILAIGAAEKRVVVKGDSMVPRTMMSLTLSADHRAVDGATAADFLRTLKELLEVPAMMML